MTDFKEMTSTDPFSLTYMRIIRLLLKTVGAWPSDSDSWKQCGKRWYLRYLALQSNILSIGVCFYIAENFDNLSFFDICDKILVALLTVLVSYRISVPMSKNFDPIVKDFVNIHLIHYKHKGEYNEQINEKIYRLSKYFILITTLMMLSGVTLFNLSPIYVNYKHGVSFGFKPENYTVVFSVSYLYPFFDPENHYEFVVIGNMWFSYICGIAVVGNDMLLCLLAFQIIGHIKTLHHDLQQIRKPGTLRVDAKFLQKKDIVKLSIDMYDSQENEEIHSRIVQCVEHHKLIVSFAEEITDLFGPMIGLSYLFHLCACCLLLLVCSQGKSDTLARYGPLTVIMFYELIQLSTIFEVVHSESETLKDSVYNMPWECMDLRNQRSVCILLHRTQTPIQITAMGMTSVGVQTMAAILKTTFSYFAFLRSMNQ